MSPNDFAAQALELIADRGCVCGGASCRDLKWLYPDNWCSPCIAAAALATPTSLACDARDASPQPHPLRREASPPGPLRAGDACGPGGAPNVP